MTTKKLVFLLFIYLIVISGILGILREVFLKEYEERYHFWISVLIGFFTGGVMVILVRILSGSLGKGGKK